MACPTLRRLRTVLDDPEPHRRPLQAASAVGVDGDSGARQARLQRMAAEVMNDRLRDELVANLAVWAADAKPTTREIEALAREVAQQEPAASTTSSDSPTTPSRMPSTPASTQPTTSLLSWLHTRTGRYPQASSSSTALVGVGKLTLTLSSSTEFDLKVTLLSPWPPPV